MVKDHSDSERGNPLPPHGLLFPINSNDSFICIIPQIVREETQCRHMGYSFRLAARVLLYASSHRQDNAYHCLCYTSRGALVGMRRTEQRLMSESSRCWCPVVYVLALMGSQEGRRGCWGQHPHLHKQRSHLGWSLQEIAVVTSVEEMSII